MSEQASLFGSYDDQPVNKPSDDRTKRLSLLITVKAAPNPSERYGETVCVAGLSTDLNSPGWIRLYPINFRELDGSDRFRKYDIVTVEAKPARQDQRRESWRPITSSMRVEHHLPPWKRRSEWLEPYIERSMCELNRGARGNPSAKSLSLVRPEDVDDLMVEQHPGWSSEEERKIRNYVDQLELPLSEKPHSLSRTALEAPRLRGSYRYRCSDQKCAGHKQGILDWEFVALQRRLAEATDSELIAHLRTRFIDGMCTENHNTAFFVGNQAKRTNVFSVLGVYYPKRG